MTTDPPVFAQSRLGPEIRRLRLALGMTVAELSTLSRVREAYLAAVEDDREEPSARALSRIALHLEPAGTSYERLASLLTAPEFDATGEYARKGPPRIPARASESVGAGPWRPAIECPRCGLFNPGDAVRCDCGYNLTSGKDSEDFSFTGTGRDYFRIWIVNVLLTIATLGVYSAWAKVRQLQYFYRNTRVAGASFDYHGNPIAILKGRVIALGLLVSYYGSGTISPTVRIVAIGLVALVLPWLLARSFRFRFHNSSYRGIRFAFSGSTRSAYWVFLVLPVLSVFTLFTLVPFCHQRIKRYQHANAACGRTGFTFDASVGDFYSIYLVAGLLSFGLLTVLGLVAATMFSRVFRPPVVNSAQSAATLVPLLILGALY